MMLLARFLKFLYYVTIVAAFCANMIVVSQTTTLSVLGTGLALRGPDGSMMTATDGLYDERSSVFLTFGYGLACTVGSVVICVWLILHWEAALCCMILVLFTCRTIWLNYQRVQKRFAFDESETVDFSDIMEGPANIKLTQNNNNFQPQPRNRNARTKYQPIHAIYSANSSASSIELGVAGSDDGSYDDWNNGKVKKRRSPHPETTIQVI